MTVELLGRTQGRARGAPPTPVHVGQQMGVEAYCAGAILNDSRVGCRGRPKGGPSLSGVTDGGEAPLAPSLLEAKDAYRTYAILNEGRAVGEAWRLHPRLTTQALSGVTTGLWGQAEGLSCSEELWPQSLLPAIAVSAGYCAGAHLAACCARCSSAILGSRTTWRWASSFL